MCFLFIVSFSICLQAAPNPDSPLLDPYICNGKNPYHVEEVLVNKVWCVTYDVENFGVTHTEDRKNSEIMRERPDTEEFKNRTLTTAMIIGAKRRQKQLVPLKTTRL